MFKTLQAFNHLDKVPETSSFLKHLLQGRMQDRTSEIDRNLYPKNIILNHPYFASLKVTGNRPNFCNKNIANTNSPRAPPVPKTTTLNQQLKNRISRDCMTMDRKELDQVARSIMLDPRKFKTKGDLCKELRRIINKMKT